MVVMDREDNTDMAHLLLSATNTYRPTTKDPTNKLKNKLAQTLRDIKNQGGLSDNKYRKVYPTSVVALRPYVLPKIHKIIGTPIRAIVSNRGSSHTRLLKNWPASSVPWLANPHITSKHPTLCATHQGGQV